MSTLATTIRFATAASAIAAAAILSPAVANASPAVPMPDATLGSLLGGDTVEPCNPASTTPCTVVGDAPRPAFAFPPLFWLGSPGNPNFTRVFGIPFPSTGDFEFCILGAAIHSNPYTGGIVGLGAGC